MVTPLILIAALSAVVGAFIGWIMGIRQTRALNPPQLRILFWAVKLVEARNQNQPWKATNFLDCELEAAVDHWNDVRKGNLPVAVVRSGEEIAQAIEDLEAGTESIAADRDKTPMAGLKVMTDSTIAVLNWTLGRPSPYEQSFRELRKILKYNGEGIRK